MDGAAETVPIGEQSAASEKEVQAHTNPPNR